MRIENAASTTNNARSLTATTGKRSRGRKRQRRSSVDDEQNKRQSLNAELQETVGSEPTEKPDANMCLKVSFKQPNLCVYSVNLPKFLKELLKYLANVLNFVIQKCKSIKICSQKETM